MVAERRRDQGRADTELRRRLAALESEIARYIEAIGSGTFSPALSERLEKAEREKAQIERQLGAGSEAIDRMVIFLPRAVERYEALVGNLAEVSRRDVNRARAQIKTILGGKVPLVPSRDRSHLIASVSADLGGLLKVAGGGQISEVARPCNR